jgi:serine/threonine protein kinase
MLDALELQTSVYHNYHINHDFENQTQTKVKGTASYTAPEVKTRKYDTKADIYSLGVIIEEMFNFNGP